MAAVPVRRYSHQASGDNFSRHVRQLRNHGLITTVSALADVASLKICDGEFLDRLANYVETRLLCPGDVLLREGHKTDAKGVCIWFLRRGVLSVEATHPTTRKRVELCLLKEGDSFGSCAVMNLCSRWPVTVRAVSICDARCVQAYMWRATLGKFPEEHTRWASIALDERMKLDELKQEAFLAWSAGMKGYNTKATRKHRSKAGKNALRGWFITGSEPVSPAYSDVSAKSVETTKTTSQDQAGLSARISVSHADPLVPKQRSSMLEYPQQQQQHRHSAISCTGLTSQLEEFRRASVHVLVPGGPSRGSSLSSVASSTDSARRASTTTLISGPFGEVVIQRPSAPSSVRTLSELTVEENASYRGGNAIVDSLVPSIAEPPVTVRFKRFKPTQWYAAHRAKMESVKVTRERRAAAEGARRRNTPRRVEDGSPYTQPSVPPGRARITESRRAYAAGRSRTSGGRKHKKSRDRIATRLLTAPLHKRTASVSPTGEDGSSGDTSSTFGPDGQSAILHSTWGSPRELPPVLNALVTYREFQTSPQSFRSPSSSVSGLAHVSARNVRDFVRDPHRPSPYCPPRPLACMIVPVVLGSIGGVARSQLGDHVDCGSPAAASSMIEKDSARLPRVRGAGGPRVVVPLEENAFITRTAARNSDHGSGETETSPLNPAGLNSGALTNVFAKRADDFEDPILLEISYDDPTTFGGRMNEIVFVDPLHDSYRPRMLVSLECVKAMHRAISILTRKVDNLLKTLSVCRTDYLKELTHLREMSNKVKHKDGDSRPTADGCPELERVRRGRGGRHEVFYFSPDLYVDGITVELVHGKIREATESMQKKLDDAQHQNALLRERLVRLQGVGADQQGMDQLRSLALVIPIEQLVIMLKVCAQESDSIKSFYKACKRVVGDDDGSDSDQASENGCESDWSGTSRSQLRRKLSESQKECERLRKQVHGLTESREQLLGQLRTLHSESLQQKCDRLEGEVRGLRADREALEAVRTENSKLKDILRKFLAGTWSSREHTALRKSLLETGLVEDSRMADEALRHLGAPVRSRVKPDCTDASFQVDVVDIAALKKGIVDSKLLIMRLQDLVKEKDQQLSTIVEELAHSEELDKMAVLGSLKATLHHGERTQDRIHGAAESSLDELWKSEDLGRVAKISKRASRNPLNRASTFMNLSVEEILRTRDVGVQADMSFSVVRASVVMKPKGRLRAFVKDKLLQDVREKAKRRSRRSVSAGNKGPDDEPNAQSAHAKIPGERQRKIKVADNHREKPASFDDEPSDEGVQPDKVGKNVQRNSKGKLLTWSDDPLQAGKGPAGVGKAESSEGDIGLIEQPEREPGELGEVRGETESKPETVLSEKARSPDGQVGIPEKVSKIESSLGGTQSVSCLPEAQAAPQRAPDAGDTRSKAEHYTGNSGELGVSDSADDKDCIDRAVQPRASGAKPAVEGDLTKDTPAATAGAVDTEQGAAVDRKELPRSPRSGEVPTAESAERQSMNRTPHNIYTTEDVVEEDADEDSSSSAASASDDTVESQVSEKSLASVEDYSELEEDKAKAVHLAPVEFCL
ncbi:hypothetical protein FOL47_002246 [Perkinsus chesapeaki]|uniref:Cyclic nucleotide-binding domain-containing protein n=1 Tax=Perkinsus chesapeaki TaxID=330153 RepID=A0A7J6N0A3_PERCH|nr:hypothetical protein FOL47_002246 [Perkinsus chesapeaki]